MDTMIEIPALRRMAELAPNSADTDARTVEVIWSAGARVRRSTLFGEPYEEELSLDPAHVRLDRLNAGAPFLKVHEIDTLDAVIGSVVPGSARIENGRGIAQVRISERADVEPIWRDIQAGHIRAVSIGYQVHRFEVSKPEAARELWRAVDWTPFEVSAVPVGADPAAGFKAYTNYDNYVGVGTWTKIGLNNTDTNDQGAFDAANNRFVAPAGGTYLFGATLLYRVNSSTSARMRGRLVLNGATEIRGSFGEISGAHVSEATALWLQTMVPLTAGDTVELQGYFRAQDGYFAADQTSFWGCKVG
jgi:hypothetical protein